MNRRRFLQIAAAACLAPGQAAAREIWRGSALGASVEITIASGDPARTRAALDAAKDTLRRMERLFSLYDRTSVLSRLNETGMVNAPPAEFLPLLEEVDAIHRASDGAFDPTIQPLWKLYSKADGRPTKTELQDTQSLIGWNKVAVTRQHIRFHQSGMALSFNGIAQGYATDRVAALLTGLGFDQCLINIGEFRAAGGPWSIGIAGNDGTIFRSVDLSDKSVATSSAGALRFSSGDGHIFNPQTGHGSSSWQSVSVFAANAARADGLSTAIAAAPAGRAQAIARAGNASRIILLDAEGEVSDISL